MQEYNGDAKVNLAHDDDDCGYNLDGSLNLCASEDAVETRHGQILKFDSGEGPFFADLEAAASDGSGQGSSEQRSWTTWR